MPELDTDDEFETGTVVSYEYGRDQRIVRGDVRDEVAESDNHEVVGTFDLPRPMTQEGACAWLLDNTNVVADMMDDESFEAEIEDTLDVVRS